MKLNNFLIALLSVFLLGSPQIVMTAEFAEDVAGDLDKDFGDLDGMSDDELANMKEEDVEKYAEDLAVLKNTDKEAYNAAEKKFGDKFNKIEGFTEKFAQKEKEVEEAAKQEEGELAEKVKDRAAKVKTREAARAPIIEDLAKEMKSLKKIDEIQASEMRSSAKDLSEIDPAREGNADIGPSNMKKKINDWIDSSDLTTEQKTALKKKINDPALKDKSKIFEEAKSVRKNIADAKVDAAFEKEGIENHSMQGNYRESNNTFFESIKSGKDEPFSTVKNIDKDFANDNVNAAMKDSRAARKEALNGKLDELGISRENLSDGEKFFSDKKSLLNESGELKSLSEEGEGYGAKRKLANKVDDFKRNISLEGAGKVVKGIWGGIAHLAESLFSAVLFMVPNLIQSAIVGGQQKKAEVKKWATPIYFGDKVYQIPDECLIASSVNVLSQGSGSYMSSSVPVYVQIPVDQIDSTVSSGVAALFNNKVSGPTANSAFYDVKRFDIHPSFYDMTDIVVSYGGIGSMTPTGGTILNGSEFGGQVISLKTGLVTDASGETFNATELQLMDGISQSPAVPVISLIAWGALNIPQTSPINQGLPSLFDTLPNILEKLELSKVASQTLHDQFDTSCLKENGGLQSKVTSCPCMLTESLEILQSGLYIQPDGTVSFGEVQLPKDASGNILNIIAAKSGADLKQLKSGIGVSQQAVKIAAPVTSQKAFKLGRLSAASATTKGTFNGLGAVIPVFGWGSNSITKSKVATLKNSKVATTIPTDSGSVFDGFTFTASPTGYAEDDTIWSAQGCWIYLCANTPFIQALQTKFPGLAASVAGPITDYVVFMDGDYNVVPLMVPENIKEQDSNGNTIWAKATFTINPVIKYWTSLIFYNDDYIVQLVSGQDQAPILFELSDKTAAPLAEPALGVMESQVTAQSPNTGKIPTFFGEAGGQPAQQPPYPIMQSFGDVFNQINLHKQALRWKTEQAQMVVTLSDNNKNVTLKKSTYSIGSTDAKGNPTTYPLYSGSKCFKSNIDDLLIPLDSNPIITGGGNPVTMPSDTVQSFVSLITDIVYQLDPTTGNYSATSTVDVPAAQGSAAYTTSGFSQSPLKLDTNNQPQKSLANRYAIHKNSATQLAFLSTFVGATNPTLDGTQTAASGVTNPLTTNTDSKNDPDDKAVLTTNKEIIKHVQSKRIEWLAAIDNIVELGTEPNTILCSLVQGMSSYAKTNNCFVYELNPANIDNTPLSLQYTTSDYFVVVNTNNPTLSSLSSLQKIPTPLKGADLSKLFFVSLISGTLYNLTDGSPVNDANGNPVRIKIDSSKYFSKTDLHKVNTTADIIYESFTTKFKNLPQNFKDAYKALVNGYNSTQAIPQGPYAFGKHKVAIRSIDEHTANYVYFNAGDMTKVHIRPKDMYVILTKTASGYQPDKYDTTKTQILLSLITGVAVDQNGNFAGIQAQDNLAPIIANYVSVPFIAQNIKKLQADYQAKQKAIQNDLAQKDQALKDLANRPDQVGAVDKDALAVINSLMPKDGGLTAPFVRLQKDSKGNYVHISPTQNAGELIYQFMSNGKVYNVSGQLVMQLSPGHLQAIRDQLGVIVDARTGKQKLGIPQFQPSLRLSKKDSALAIGQTGDDMVAVGSADYPDPSITMAQGNGLFYNRSMDTYYILDTAKNLWMSVDAGHVYKKNGSPVIDSKTVATFTSSKTGKVYPLLLEMNSSGYMQGFLSDGVKYANLSTSNKNMTWLGLSGDFNQYTITTDAASDNATPTKYTVSYSTSQTRTFTVNTDYAWQKLALVPLDKNGALLKDIPGDSYQFMHLVTNGSSLSFVIYNDSLYEVAKGSKGTYTLTPFNAKDSNAVTGLKITTGLVDKGTNNLYVEIIDGKNSYKYGYMPKIFDSAQQVANRTNIIKGVTAASPISVQVGPMEDAIIKVLGKNVSGKKATSTTNVIFTQDLPMKSGAVAVKKATIKDIVNPVDSKANPKAYDTFVTDLRLSGSSIGNGIMKTTDGRFMYKLEDGTYSYILQDSYVDLKNGALFDATTGLSLGLCLLIDDFIAVLDECGVAVNNKTVTYTQAQGKDAKGNEIATKDVVINPKGENMLQYRGVKQQAAAANTTTNTTA